MARFRYPLCMLQKIDLLRLELGLCPSRLLLLARYSAKRNVNAIGELNALERFELIECMTTMRDHGRPVAYRCAASA